jgi:FAD/FMN-containing dehydrogenase
MNQIGSVDLLGQTLRVQAGAITEAVHQHCASFGLMWPIDFAAKGSSHIGGNIATNAGGIKVIRYGLTRNWILGLQVVTGSGQILELNGSLEKNNTGIDLRQFFIGSEGILGVVTEAILKLTRVPQSLQVCFFALEDITAVLKLFQRARKGPFTITAFEFLNEPCLNLVLRTHALPRPVSGKYPYFVLLEVEIPTGADQTSLDEWLASLFEEKMVQEGRQAQSTQEAAQLWSLRENISESLALSGFVHKNDIALPLVHLEQFIAKMIPLFQQVSIKEDQFFLFGHIGDGNLHVNTLKPAHLNKTEFLQLCHQTDEALFTLLRAYQGSVSAEHGIGLLKKDILHYSRSPDEIALMKSLKRVFDPNGILNPGKVF